MECDAPSSQCDGLWGWVERGLDRVASDPRHSGGMDLVLASSPGSVRKPRPRWASFLSLSIVALHACNRAPSKKSDLEVGTAAGRAAASVVTPFADAAVDIARYGFSASADSTIRFVAADSARKYAGSIPAFQGTVLVRHGRSREASVSVEIDVTSLQMNDAQLDMLLKSAKFLNVESYPQARFVSTSVEPGGAQGATDTVKGNLELHGVTRPIEIPGTIHVGPNDVNIDAELRLSRRAFGLILQTSYESAINDDIIISLVITANRLK
jgi:polyisoprenoid-binding protein YceI